jgi:hypothetical protein
MNAGSSKTALALALELSNELLAVAEAGDLGAVADLDADRRRLLDSWRPMIGHMDPSERLMLQKISELNDRALGFLEHRRRRTERLMDTAVAGRRALIAYSATRLQR